MVSSGKDMYLVDVGLLDGAVKNHTKRAEQNSQRLFSDQSSHLVRDVGDMNRCRFDTIVMLRRFGVLLAAKRCPAHTVTKRKGENKKLICSRVVILPNVTPTKECPVNRIHGFLCTRSARELDETVRQVS